MARQFYSSSGMLVRGRFLWFRELGHRKFMVLQKFQGKVKLHIRNYVLEEEEFVLIPTKRGVTLDKQQTRDLIAGVKDMLKVVKRVSNSLIHSFILSFFHSCIHSFIHSNIHLLISMHSLIHSFTHSVIQSFVHSLVHSCIHAFSSDICSTSESSFVLFANFLTFLLW